MIYDRIPETHLLKRIDKAVDFSFINDLLADQYCRNFGRPAKEPEMMMKLLFLQSIYTWSDVNVLENANVNIAILNFLGVEPDEKLPDPSLLSKFRTQRLKEFTLDDVITEIVRQCVENGTVKGDGVSIDATHIEANTVKKIPERIMKHLAKRIFKGLEKDHGSVPDHVDTGIPNYKTIEDHNEARQVMKTYLEKVMEEAEPYAGEETSAALAEAKEVLSDERFMIQKGLRSLVDKEARVGSKSKTEHFFGYKDEYMMTTEERLITAVMVHNGEYVDGSSYKFLMENTQAAGIQPKEIYGDKAYFRKDILEQIKEMKAAAYIPVSASVYKVNEERFCYNKDSDQWICNMGNTTIRKTSGKEKKRGKEYPYLKYYFDKEQCQHCPHRESCLGKNDGKQKTMRVSLNTSEYYEISQKQQTPEFQEKYKKRAAHEWKNAEQKRFHGLARAKGFGLKSVTIQAKLTAIAVNLKRIAALNSGTETTPSAAFELIVRFSYYFVERLTIYPNYSLTCAM